MAGKGRAERTLVEVSRCQGEMADSLLNVPIYGVPPPKRQGPSEVLGDTARPMAFYLRGTYPRPEMAVQAIVRYSRHLAMY